jgi:hypothetical protein
VLRDDVEARDLPAAAVMVVAAAAPFGGEARADRWDRYLAFVLDALAADGPRGSLPELAPPPGSEVADRLDGTCATACPRVTVRKDLPVPAR